MIGAIGVWIEARFDHLGVYVLKEGEVAMAFWKYCWCYGGKVVECMGSEQQCHRLVEEWKPKRKELFCCLLIYAESA